MKKDEDEIKEFMALKKKNKIYIYDDDITLRVTIHITMNAD